MVGGSKEFEKFVRFLVIKHGDFFPKRVFGLGKQFFWSFWFRIKILFEKVSGNDENLGKSPSYQDCV